MFLHLGDECVVSMSDIIGIFDIEMCTTTQNTRDFLRDSENKNQADTITTELPKSFVVCNKLNKKNQRVYISQISTATLKKRANTFDE